MNVVQKVGLPLAVAAAGFVGVSGASLLSNSAVNAAAATTSTTSASTTSSNDANGSSNSSSSTPSQAMGPHQANGITETALTGDAYTQAVAAAQAAESGATVIRAETDAEGAAYEVHMQKSDGSMVTVKLDSSFKVTSTEDGMR